MVSGRSVAIIGSGDFARAMALRLLRHDYHVKLHSRNPEKQRMTSQNKALAEVALVGWDAPFDYADYVFAAVPNHVYNSLGKLRHALADRIVIDVSNPTSAGEEKSGAETLQDLLPESRVVKAFNSISAYNLQSDVSGESRVVLVCGNDVTSRQNVAQLARELGFAALEGGSLLQARQAEGAQRLLCAEWVKPTVVLAVLMVLWTIYAYLRYYVFRTAYTTLDRIPTNLMNKVFGCVSSTLLALVYLPGSIAAIVQLVRGTKYRSFAAWLDEWLKMRKQLGLYALFTGWMHVLMSMTIMNSAYFRGWFITSSVTLNTTSGTVTIAQDSRLNLNGELNVLFGLLGAMLMIVPGIASIPAVGALLNWREWKLVQAGIGLSAMIFAITHVTIKGAFSWVKNPKFASVVPSMAFVSSFLPWLCLALIFILWLPCFRLPLRRIRGGWERGTMRKQDEEALSGTTKNDQKLSSIAFIGTTAHSDDKEAKTNGIRTNNSTEAST